ncbi:MAG: DUF502 domain-containing protein [Candidatus Marinimicrobia bacterium]|jgi:uncharacterized membrane protein|nr:DUF502 domain-containing protein [Candidatus Neomarinimicrobiota bacterium]MBT3938010.1 DUF502 domain-containing protein [Candidatus Neomarinimicrobiota bacterium]MBT3961578.1 DUF502 domain-containing protein [Candidatus Neomarinimicrobiota bacterium]MBT4382034.1 DUF502 domain-containing protein [Candidatus Neomarinimicrobiota bacterium]MBT4636111.1 DUF502 domain-containing protein [Candidatus Neomarinimicrobiota bacterium]
MKNPLLHNFKSKIFAGIAALFPIYLTYFVLKFLLDILSQMSLPVLKKIGLDEIPGLGILLTLVLIYLLGVIVSNFLGRKLFGLGERILKRVPIVNTIYSTLKQITETFTGKTADAFKGAVYIQYPRVGLWTMAFISGESKTENGQLHYHLFVPTTPNPTSGFFLMIPAKDTIPTGMTVEEGLKTIISGGMLAPNTNPLSDTE